MNNIIIPIIITILIPIILFFIWTDCKKTTDEATTEVEVVTDDLFIEMSVSAYCPGECCCGEWADGFTASGKSAKGLIIAAPPEYPFGTIMDVPGYGVASVEDRGGLIKGNRLDLLFPTHQEALEWGRQNIIVKVQK